MAKRKRDPKIKVPRLVKLEDKKSAKKKKFETKVTGRPYNK
ncbi:MAG: hypothetical protein WC473_00260 [Patescibacteria group bacterium]